ncbi:uncharacterized protein LOC103570721 [Microplitis demolitor]|uniref:uncharacterized protein LOC103570721 n=1 Tax=Microplitis demolitor TaxID=69319 RepID=UPI0004CD6A0F|nr:uncharacterized protein LOC103570721 [Microplitis demolitor]
MGSIVSYFVRDRGQTGLEGAVDHKNTEFSQRQKKIMRKAWDLYISSNLINIGVEVMLSLLNDYDDIKQMFPDFKSIPNEQLRNNKKFNAHCQMIMSVINNAVNAFLNNDNELFVAILKVTGERHGKRAGNLIIIKHFQRLQDPLIQVLKRHIKSHWTNEMSNLWTCAVKKILQVIIHGVQESLSS